MRSEVNKALDLTWFAIKKFVWLNWLKHQKLSITENGLEIHAFDWMGTVYVRK